MIKKSQSKDNLRAHLLACLTSVKFLEGRSLGSQAPIFIAAHDPIFESEDNNLPGWLVSNAALMGSTIIHLDIFSELIASLEDQGILTNLLDQERSGFLGQKSLTAAIHSAAQLSNWISARLQKELLENQAQAVVFSGLGAAYPYFRTSELVGILEIGQLSIPAVILFPGTFDGTLRSPVLKLFGQIDETHNYRALDIFNYEP
jgi:hypothetical protein